MDSFWVGAMVGAAIVPLVLSLALFFCVIAWKVMK